MSNYCHLCNRFFCNNRALYQHVYAVHFKCRCCSDFFPDVEEKEDHEDNMHYCCSKCSDVFDRDPDLEAHMETDHPQCDHCQKIFVDPLALQNHLDSGIHFVPTSTCRYCEKPFKFVSAMTQHLENGQCPERQMTREGVKHIVRSRARNLNMEHSLLAPQSEGNEVPQCATSQSWNGWSYECCICSREFGQLSNLNHHLITHEPKDYLCRRCKKRFKLLSAVIQHWEKSRCDQTVPDRMLVG